MVSKKDISDINKLKQKKYRNIFGLFVAEGEKVIKELLNSGYKLRYFLTDIDSAEIPKHKFSIDPEVVNRKMIEKLSSFTNPSSFISVFEIPKTKKLLKGPIVALDNIRDPGNMGTILRTCHWFGIKQVVCSLNSVDCYNSKVVQSSMGAISKINIIYEDLEKFIESTDMKVISADIKGENIDDYETTKDFVLILSNESNGLTESLEKHVDHKISIPRISPDDSIDSLNVAIAGGIILSRLI